MRPVRQFPSILHLSSFHLPLPLLAALVVVVSLVGVELAAADLATAHLVVAVGQMAMEILVATATVVVTVMAGHRLLLMQTAS